MISRENDCVGCETCIGCSRKEDYWVFKCDICGEVFYDEDEVTRINGHDYCERCYEREFEEEEEAV